MAFHSLNDSFDLDGSWWLPDKPENVISGSLNYTPQKAELRLHGVLTPWIGEGQAFSFDNGFARDYPVVHGKTINGQQVTLLRAQRIGLNSAFSSETTAQRERLISSWVLLGTNANEDQRYESVAFLIPGLHLWVGSPLVRRRNDESGAAKTFDLVCKEIPEMPIEVIDGAIELVLNYEGQTSFYRVDLEMVAWLRVLAREPKPLSWFMDQHAALGALFALLADVPMGPNRVVAVLPEQKPIDVLFATRESACCPYDRDSQFAVSRRELQVEIHDLFKQWFNVYPKVKTASQLAVSIIGSKELWPHVEFLSLMQALEGLHRAMYPGIYMQDEEYEGVKRLLGSAIPSTLTQSHKMSLRSKIKYGNQFSLRKRLNELVNTLDKELCLEILGDGGTVPQRWIDTRNYFTHWDDTLRDNIVFPEDMHEASHRLRQLLRVLYLKVAGVPSAALRSALGNHSDASQYLRQLNAREKARSS